MRRGNNDCRTIGSARVRHSLARSPVLPTARPFARSLVKLNWSVTPFSTLIANPLRSEEAQTLSLTRSFALLFAGAPYQSCRCEGISYLRCIGRPLWRLVSLPGLASWNGAGSRVARNCRARAEAAIIYLIIRRLRRAPL